MSEVTQVIKGIRAFSAQYNKPNIIIGISYDVTLYDENEEVKHDVNNANIQISLDEKMTDSLISALEQAGKVRKIEKSPW